MFLNDAILKCIINLCYFYFIFSTLPPSSKSIIYFHSLYSTWREKANHRPKQNICPTFHSFFTLILPGKRQCPRVMRDVAIHNFVVERKILNTEKISFWSPSNINQANVRAKLSAWFPHDYNSLQNGIWKLSELLDPVPQILINFFNLGILVSIC